MFKYSHIKYSSVLPILVLLLAHSLCLLANQSADSKNKAGGDASSPPPRSPLDYFDLGPFRFESFANKTKYQDKMRFSKSFMKLVISSRIFGANSPPLSTVKISRLEELVRCENLTLAKADMEPLVDCRPLESYVLEGLHERVPNSKDKKNSNVMYVQRVTIRAKAKSPFLGDESGRQDFVMYPLRDDVVRRNVKSILAANDLASDDFADSMSDEYGFYLETEVPTMLSTVRCTANAFMSFNDSIIYNSLNTDANERDPIDATSDKTSANVDEPTAESVVQEFADFFNVVSRDGLFFSVQDVSCGRTDTFIPFSVDQDFTLAMRNKFPYVTCKHNIVTRPIGQLWKYSGEISQTRDEAHPLGQGEQPKAYNTTIRVKSMSGMFDNLVFQIDQDFANEGTQSGWEEMVLVHKALVAVVRGNWSADSFVKMLLIHPTVDEHFKPSDKPSMMLIYNDQAEDDYVGLTLKLERNLYKQLMGDAKALYSAGKSVDEADSYESAGQVDGHAGSAHGSDDGGDGKAPRIEL